MAKRDPRQLYPREDDIPLAKADLFPRMASPLSDEYLQSAIEKAFERSKLTKNGNLRKNPDSPKALVKQCMKHLKERADPVLGTSFYGQLNSIDIFDMDGIPHEMQRLRMQIGIFYQFLLIELMRASIKYNQDNGHPNYIIQASDGTREGDITVDIISPTFAKGIRLYMSVKKSSDTVGGQDVGGVIKRLEKLAKEEKNLTSPYLCVIAVATPSKGKVLSYEKSRSIRYNQDGHPYSENCEVWTPGFIYPYISGREAVDIYAKSLECIESHMPFYSLKYRTECAELFKKEFIKLGIANADGTVNRDKFFEFIVSQSENLRE
ncbi:MAG: hypothetical protein A4E23_01463 [Methanomethylovorans sp. PtaU1.Bin073]|nr:MAG: hypothetical protein A4E23_01463 [Methanomethylovorans sp. PtaU1.Bin073]